MELKSPGFVRGIMGAVIPYFQKSPSSTSFCMDMDMIILCVNYDTGELKDGFPGTAMFLALSLHLNLVSNCLSQKLDKWLGVVHLLLCFLLKELFLDRKIQSIERRNGRMITVE